MRYINTLREGDVIRSIYLCKTKRSAETRNGKPYDNLLLQEIKFIFLYLLHKKIGCFCTSPPVLQR